MRVIAGELRGRALSAPKGQITRPTSDRVREALFSMLGEISGLRVLDLFAGTGALGIEALSRGAASAVFIEPDRGALRALQGNLQTLRLLADRAEVRATDARTAMRTARERRETYDLIFIDPPYNQASDWSDSLSEELPALCKERARVIVESDRRTPLELTFPSERERRYGQTLITIHRIP